MEEEDYKDRLKFGFQKTINMGRALGIGFCYAEGLYGNESYLYINLWKYNLSIGRFYH